MRNGNEAAEQRPKYYFVVCSRCGSKMHKETQVCPNCGAKEHEWRDFTIGFSYDEADKKYDIPLNNAFICVQCDLYKNGSPCPVAWYGGNCFGTGSAGK